MGRIYTDLTATPETDVTGAEFLAELLKGEGFTMEGITEVGRRWSIAEEEILLAQQMHRDFKLIGDDEQLFRTTLASEVASVSVRLLLPGSHAEWNHEAAAWASDDPTEWAKDYMGTIKGVWRSLSSKVIAGEPLASDPAWDRFRELACYLTILRLGMGEEAYQAALTE